MRLLTSSRWTACVTDEVGDWGMVVFWGLCLAIWCLGLPSHKPAHRLKYITTGCTSVVRRTSTIDDGKQWPTLDDRLARRMLLRELLACFAAPWSSVRRPHDDDRGHERAGHQTRTGTVRPDDAPVDSRAGDQEDGQQQQQQQETTEAATNAAPAPSPVAAEPVEGTGREAAAVGLSSVEGEREEDEHRTLHAGTALHAPPALHVGQDEEEEERTVIACPPSPPRHAAVDAAAAPAAMTPSPASPSSVSSAGSSFRASSSRSGLRSATPPAKGGKAVKGVDGRSRRVAMASVTYE